MIRSKITTRLLLALLIIGVGVAFSYQHASASYYVPEVSPYDAPDIDPDDSFNSAPIADAGSDQSVVDADNDGFEALSLDGSGSIDLDGQVEGYYWFGDISLVNSEPYISGPISEPAGTDAVMVATGTAPVIDFPTGSYELYLIVVDDEGTASVPDYVTVIVTPGDGEGDNDEEVTDIQLGTSTYKQKGKISVDLSWNTTSASQVDIYRDGVVIATVANNGSYTDNTGAKGNTTFAYKVCEEGTNICSNDAVSSTK